MTTQPEPTKPRYKAEYSFISGYWRVWDYGTNGFVDRMPNGRIIDPIDRKEAEAIARELNSKEE